MEKKKTKVDLLEERRSKPQKTDSYSKIWFLVRIFLFLLVFIFLSGVAITYQAISSATQRIVVSEPQKDLSLISQIKHLIGLKQNTLKGEEEGRINFLLMGLGGEGHEGAYLTDTIILLSIKPDLNKAAIISIPRDLYVPIPDVGYRKINYAYAHGHYHKEKYGSGELLLAQVISDLFHIPIHYYARIDFEGFKKIVDELGGVDIYVERSFTDYRFPTKNYGYTTISFKKGWEKMNGERALMYVRSRYGTNGENTDFARSRRQQKFLLALRDKILTYQTLINPKKIQEILNILGDHLRTNLQPWEMIKLFELAKEIDSKKVIRFGLSSSPGGLLISQTTPDGAYILVPQAGFGNFSEIQNLIQNIFQTSRLAEENARIEIINGTPYPWYTKELENFLKKYNLKIVNKSNKPNQNTSATQIYDYTASQKPETLRFLKESLRAEVISPLSLFIDSLQKEEIELTPSIVKPSTSQKVDFLIIIGRDFQLKF